jgi:DNA adenine methylase
VIRSEAVPHGTVVPRRTKTKPPKICPPLKWWGGKHYLAAKIVTLMPPHTHYVEPYAGGLAVLLAKDPEGVSEVVNDLNGDLTNFWKVLQGEDTFARFRRIIEAVPFSEAEWQQALEDLQDPFAGDSVERAVWFFIVCRQSRAGQMRDFVTTVRSRTRRGMQDHVSAWLTAVEGLPAIHARLNRILVLNRPALEVLRAEDSKHTVFYCDSPYHPSTRSSPDAYAFEMTDADHREYLDAANVCKGKVLISGYDCPLYAEKLAHWHRVTFDLPNNTAGGKRKARMTEVLWLNYEPPTNQETTS